MMGEGNQEVQRCLPWTGEVWAETSGMNGASQWRRKARVCCAPNLSCAFSSPWLWSLSSFPTRIPFFLLNILFIHERHRETESGQREKQAPCKEPPLRDSIPGSQDHDLSQRQTLNHWATQVPLEHLSFLLKCYTHLSSPAKMSAPPLNLPWALQLKVLSHFLYHSM